MKAIITTFMISMVPLFELRGAIPYGVIVGLNLKEVLILCIIGNLLPVPFLIIFTRKIFAILRKKSDSLNNFVLRLESKAEKKKGIVEKYEFLGLVILVAVPLPGTGAWTGALVAAMMDMRIKRAFPAIAIGVVIAGIVVAWMTYGIKALA